MSREAHVLASEERYRQLAEHARDLIMRLRLRPAPAYEYVNPAAIAITGYTPDDFYADPDLLLKMMHPDDRPLEEAIRRSPGFPTGPVTVRLVRKDGTTAWLEKRVVPIHDDTGEVTAIESVARDISERKWVDEALQRRRAEVLGHVARQVQAPLAAIKGSATLALATQEAMGPAKARQLFQLIDEQAERLGQLVENLADVARIDEGRLEISPEPVNLVHLLGEVRDRFEPLHTHPLRLDIPHGLPAIQADRRRIFQVLETLLVLAAAEAPRRAPVAIAVEHNGVDVTLRVEGPGMRIGSGWLGPLLQPFWPVGGTAGASVPEAHLDIALCRGIVEAHRGRIWAEPGAEGEGATVSFTLPIAREASPSPAGAAIPPMAGRRESSRSRILLVGRDPGGTRYLQRLLADAGYSVIVTRDPSQALPLLELEEPHLALVEVPRGADSLQIVRSLRECSPGPILALGDDRDSGASVRALKAGADDFIRQPFVPAELLARIEAALRRRGPAAPARERPPFVSGDLAIDFVRRRVTVAGEAIALSATEYRLLRELASEAGRVLTYDQLLTRVWGPSYMGSLNLVRSFVRNLRRRLGDDAAVPRYVLTERQVGYRLASP